MFQIQNFSSLWVRLILLTMLMILLNLCIVECYSYKLVFLSSSLAHGMRLFMEHSRLSRETPRDKFETSLCVQRPMAYNHRSIAVSAMWCSGLYHPMLASPS
jgi:hypothetical protein